MKTLFLLISAVLAALSGSGPLRAQESTADKIHTPVAGSAERTAILDVLHREYTTGSGPKVKFKVNYLKVHNGWAWINVVPLNSSGEPEGDPWPSLLRNQNGVWSSIDLVAVGQDLGESDGPQSPTKRFLQALQKKYPTVPADIVPVGH
jgi:hypothetical protein